MTRASTFSVLRREPPILGLPARSFFASMLFVLAVIGLRGLDLIAIVIAAVVYLVVLAFLKPMLDREPELLDLLPSLTRYQERYSRHGVMKKAAKEGFYIKSRPS